MGYDEWKLMTPEEDAGVHSVPYMVNVHVCTSEQGFKESWSDHKHMTNLEKILVDWDDDSLEFDIEFDIEIKIYIWESDLDEDYEIKDKIWDEVDEYITNTGFTYDYDIINYR